MKGLVPILLLAAALSCDMTGPIPGSLDGSGGGVDTPMGGGDMGGMMTGKGGVPHLIEVATGEDLGVVLWPGPFGVNAPPIIFSAKLNAPLNLMATAFLVYPSLDCKGSQMVRVPTDPISNALDYPIYVAGPTGTYWRLAGKSVNVANFSYYSEPDKICRTGGPGVVDEYADTGIRANKYMNAGRNYRIELR